MNHTYKRSVFYLAGLLLVAAQFVSVVHAADHPFHAEEKTCAAFVSLEQHDHAITVLPATNLHPQSTCIVFTGITSVFSDNPSFIFRSRAPPLHT